jgi:hypothetical protein
MSERIGWFADREQTYEEGWRVTLTPEEEKEITKTIQDWAKAQSKNKIEKPFKDEEDLFNI